MTSQEPERHLDLDMADHLVGEYLEERTKAIHEKQNEVVRDMGLLIYDAVAQLEHAGITEISKEEFEQKVVSDLLYPPENRDLQAEGLPEVAMFVAEAASAGVVGNLAYEALKEAFKRLPFPLRRPKPRVVQNSGDGEKSETPDPASVLDHLVKVAVIAQCEAHGLTAPSYASLHVKQWKYDGTYRDGTYTAIMRTTDDSLTAIVSVVSAPSPSKELLHVRIVPGRGN